jgi:uncharacterized peroxidase-related enzyme
VAHHRVGLTRSLAADDLSAADVAAMVASLIAHPRNGASLHSLVAEQERALLRYALKLTMTPSDMAPRDVQQLRDAGLDDGEILDAAHVVAYYAYANRIADGLGITVEPYRQEG